ncbi:Psf2-domain-containing protein [Meredithblackwellia eburnea MCA 4105]
MSVSRQRRIGPTPADIEFRSLEDDIVILPTLSLPAIPSLDGPRMMYGPLKAMQRTEVPLWLALHLKKKRKCKIITPAWLTIPELEETLREELQQGGFAALPRHYVEISKILLEVASNDMENPDKVRILLKDIREARQSKVREGLQAINSTHLAMPNLSQMELTELRPFFAGAHRRLLVLDPENELHSRIESLWLEDPGKALRLAPDPEEYNGGPDNPPRNRLVEMIKEDIERERIEDAMDEDA